MLIPIIRFFEDEEVGTEPMKSAKSCFSLGWKNAEDLENCERKLNTSLQMIHLAFLGVLLRRSRTGS